MTTKTSKTTASGMIQIKQVRSAICSPAKHKRVIKGLGFTRLNQVIERPNTSAIPWHGEEGASPGGDCRLGHSSRSQVTGIPVTGDQ